MNKREKTLAMLVGVAATAYGGSNVVWPMVDEYVFAVTRENEALRLELEDKDARLDEVRPFRLAYRDYLARTGGTDAEKVQNELHERLTRLMDAAGLGNPRVSPRAISDYKPADRKVRKAGIKLVRFTIAAEGPLSSVVSFLRSYYEVPFISRMTSLKLTPPSGRGAKRGTSGPVSLTASVEALVPPDHPVSEVNPARLEQPASFVKHSGRDYGLIASRDPFTEYYKPPPPPPPPVVRKPVEPPKVVKADPKPSPPPPPPPPSGDADRDHKVIRMVMMYGDGKASVEELLVVNTRDKTTEYVRLGETLDGGDVVVVHPTGAVSRREDGSARVYGVGVTLSDGLPIEEADAKYPEVVYAYDKIKDQFDPKPAPGGQAGEGGDDDGGEKDAGPAEVDKGIVKPSSGKIGETKGAAEKAERPRIVNPATEALLKARREAARRSRGAKRRKSATAGPSATNKAAGSVKPVRSGKPVAGPGTSGKGEGDKAPAAEVKPGGSKAPGGKKKASGGDVKNASDRQGTSDKKKAGGRKSNGQKAGGGKKQSDKKSGGKKAGEKKTGEKKAGDKKAGDKKAGDKKAGDKKAGDKKSGEKKAGGKSGSGEKGDSKKGGGDKGGENKKAGGKGGKGAQKGSKGANESGGKKSGGGRS